MPTRICLVSIISHAHIHTYSRLYVCECVQLTLNISFINVPRPGPNSMICVFSGLPSLIHSVKYQIPHNFLRKKKGGEEPSVTMYSMYIYPYLSKDLTDFW